MKSRYVGKTTVDVPALMPLTPSMAACKRSQHLHSRKLRCYVRVRVASVTERNYAPFALPLAWEAAWATCGTPENLHR